MRDLRTAVRMLLQAKGWTAVVLLSLALGIGANTALFSALNGLLIQKLPVDDPDTLVRFRHTGPNHLRTDVLSYGFIAPAANGQRIEATFSYPMYLQLVEDNRTLSNLFACAPLGRVNVVVNGQAEIASGFFSSGNYYRALGAKARLGRTIAPDDDRPAAAPVATISHKYWRSRFGSSPDVVGSVVRVNNVPLTIVGVLAPGFTGVGQPIDDAPDVAVPLALEPQINLQPSDLQKSLLTAPNFWWLQIMGRLKPGVTAAQAQANFAGVFQHAARAQFETFLSAIPSELREQFGQKKGSGAPELIVDSGSRGIYDVERSDLRFVAMLTAAVALVLLLVCANVANLLLSRSTARQKELAIRLTLGATRTRLVRQLLTESLLLAVIGGGLGILVGDWGQRLLPGTAGQAAPLDWRVLAFALALSTAAGLGFGIAPALRGARMGVAGALKDNGRGISRSPALLGKALVIAQVTISLMLLVAAGLFFRTVQNLRHVDVGFNSRNVVLFRVIPGLNRYDAATQTQLYDRIGERLRTIGGVRAVAWSNPGLLTGRNFSSAIVVQGRGDAAGGEAIAELLVSPTFFATMEIPLAAGRGFTAADTEGAPPVAVINEAAARRYFPNASPIGRRFGSTARESGRIEIVGVVRDAKYTSLRNAVEPAIYRPQLQSPAQGSATFEVRTAGDPLVAIAAIRDAVRAVDPGLPLVNVGTQEQAIADRFRQERMFAQSYALFSLLALVLASIGLFGLMSYAVARRTNEIGIRMALGAQGSDVRRLVMRESMALVGAGVAIGIGATLLAGRFLSTLLFGLAPSDPLTIAAAVAGILLVSAAGGYLPARRASRVDPLVALRE